MKTIIRFSIGYTIGALLVGSWLISQGDAVEGTTRLLVSWLPIGTVYGALVATALRAGKLYRMIGMLELSGLCVGLFPLFCGLWPTYSMHWELALIMVAVQCAALALAVGAVFLANRFVGSLRNPDGEPPAAK
jgi:hypothetical protein